MSAVTSQKLSSFLVPFSHVRIPLIFTRQMPPHPSLAVHNQPSLSIFSQSSPIQRALIHITSTKIPLICTPPIFTHILIDTASSAFQPSTFPVSSFRPFTPIHAISIHRYLTHLTSIPFTVRMLTLVLNLPVESLVHSPNCLSTSFFLPLIFSTSFQVLFIL